MAKDFVTKDSGKRQEYQSGMKRDIQEGKPRFDLCYMPMFERWAALMTRGMEKYGENNWKKANSLEELNRFRASAMRHFMQWFNNVDQTEDHAAAVLFNISAVEYLKDKIGVETDGKIWIQPVSLQNYEVSNEGDIRRKTDNRLMAKWCNKFGYQLVSLSNEERKHYQIHRLVAEAFLGPSKLQVNHKNGVKTDNNIDNLEYCTASENNQHSYTKLGRKASKHNAKITYEIAEEIRSLVAEGLKQKDIAKKYQLSPQTINDIIKYRIWKEEQK